MTPSHTTSNSEQEDNAAMSDVTAEIEAKAREFYEASRKIVSGRPRWEKLDPLDDYHMGMKEHAYSLAREDLAKGSTP